ncbi:hypothetical protein MSIMFI_05353 [Mycobacterium simulans]|nr:hypothetical protein MSIMFI_05353 [Mycobacterium simulans]
MCSGAAAGMEFAGSSAATDAGGACCRITWALVPLIPNDETPAVRGCPVCGHGTGSVNNRTAPADQSMCGLGSSTCRVGGRMSWLSAKTILISPAAPAAAWVWPILDLIEPNHTGSSGLRWAPYVANNAPASIGSPNRVPVPWASTTST